MTVGELRAALVGLDDGLDVTVRAERDFDGESFCGGIRSVGVEFSHADDAPFFAIDASDLEDYSPNVELAQEKDPHT